MSILKDDVINEAFAVLTALKSNGGRVKTCVVRVDVVDEVVDYAFNTMIECAVGDVVVVNMHSSISSDEFKHDCLVGTVVEASDWHPATGPLYWVIDKIDLSHHVFVRKAFAFLNNVNNV